VCSNESGIDNRRIRIAQATIAPVANFRHLGRSPASDAPGAREAGGEEQRRGAGTTRCQCGFDRRSACDEITNAGDSSSIVHSREQFEQRTEITMLVRVSLCTRNGVPASASQPGHGAGNRQSFAIGIGAGREDITQAYQRHQQSARAL
jgi:hypothetical protein